MLTEGDPDPQPIRELKTGVLPQEFGMQTSDSEASQAIFGFIVIALTTALAVVMGAFLAILAIYG